jgi:hypothetical protein
MNLKLGWLSPDGELYVCNSYDHTELARDIVKQFNYPRYDMQGNYFEPDDNLLNHKWVRIAVSSLGRKEWRISWKDFLTDYQKQFLKPYFEDTEIPMGYLAQAKWDRENDG